MRNTKKTAAKIAVLLVAAVLLQSCGSIKITELNERLIIEAIGIDFSQNGGYTVTVQALNSSSPAGNSEDENEGEITQNLVFSGKTVGEALNGISVHTGKTPLYSQARVLIIGYDAAKESISEALDFFLREYTTRTDILTAISKKSAKELICASSDKKAVGATVIENALRSGEYTGNVTGIPLYKFINLLLDEKSGAFCPIIDAEKEETSDTRRVEPVGTALFADGEFTGTLTKEETRGLLYLIDRLSSADIPTETEDGLFTLRAVKSTTKIKPPEKGSLNFTIEIKTECDITEYETKNFERLNKEAVEKVRFACENRIKERVNSALKSSYYDAGSDICRFERRFWLSQPNRYRELIDENGEFTQKFTADINVTVKIRRTGKETLYG